MWSELRRSAIAAVVLLFIAPATLAQVVSPAGTMDVMFTVQHSHIDTHTNRHGDTAHDIDLRSTIATVNVEYSLTDRWAVGVAVPYIQSRYRGPAPHHGAVVDDGRMHGSLQDLQVDLRYGVTRGHTLLTPFAAFRYPMRDYPTLGHAAPGRGLRELEFGVSAGRQFLTHPNAVFGANVAYVYSEELHDIRVNRTLADVQLGYVVTDRLFVRAFGAWQVSHGGLDLPLPPQSEHFHHHDQLARANYTRAGGGFVYSLTDRFDLHAAYATVLRSVNAHKGRSVSIGVNWTFAPGSDGY
ncbi:MAG TPA: hypothetical protein VM779_09410 [Thermoanaerobaculia bacterium]|nr:hypothetical protein [Thermoanaerobaculia bacterium]